MKVVERDRDTWNFKQNFGPGPLNIYILGHFMRGIYQTINENSNRSSES